jgi:hypothetical protein
MNATNMIQALTESKKHIYFCCWKVGRKQRKLFRLFITKTQRLCIRCIFIHSLPKSEIMALVVCDKG